MKADEFRFQRDFEATLQPGMRVQGRWTNCGSFYGSHNLEVTCVNRASVRVRLLADCGKDYLKSGHEFPLPRMGAAKWSFNNGIFPRGNAGGGEK